MNNKQELSEKMGFEIIGGLTLFIVPALLVREGHANSACESLERCSPVMLNCVYSFLSLTTFLNYNTAKGFMKGI